MGNDLKIAVLGLFGQRNWGNDVTFEAFLEHAAAHVPLSRIVCICTGPAEVAKNYGIRTFPMKPPPVIRQGDDSSAPVRLLKKLLFRLPLEIRHWWQGFKLLSGVKAVVAPGTGLLNDYASSAMGRPFDILKWSILAGINRSRLSFISMGAGPVTSSLSWTFLRRSLNISGYRSFRDEYSRDYLLKLGFESGTDPICPDLAFSLSPDRFPAPNPGRGPGTVVGVGFKDYYGHEGVRREASGIYEGYVSRMAEMLHWLIDGGYTLRLIMGDSTFDEPVKMDVLKCLESRFGPVRDGAIINEPIDGVGDLLEQLAQVDYVVSARFHNLILGVMMDKPVVSLGYNEKFDHLMEALELQEYHQDLSVLDVELFKRQFGQLVRDRGQVMERVRLKMRENRNALARQYDLIWKDAGVK